MFMKFKNTFKLVVFAFVFALPLNVFADESGLKIGLVDMQKIENEALMAKDLQKKMKAKEEELGNDLVKRKNKIESEFKALEGKRAVLSGEELQKKAKKLEGDFQKLQMDEKVYMQVFDLTRMRAMQEIQDNLKKAVNKVADKYDMIVPSNLALYVNTSKFDDLTSKVIDKLNGISKSVSYDKFYKEAKEHVDELIESQKKRLKK